MACRITEIVLDCTDPELLASFWCAVLDYQVLDRDETGVEIGLPDRRMTLVFFKNGEVKQQKLRMHIDLNATDRDQQAELERLLALGARLKDIGQDGVGWHVLEDPEGNEFCLLKRRVTP